MTLSLIVTLSSKSNRYGSIPRNNTQVIASYCRIWFVLLMNNVFQFYDKVGWNFGQPANLSEKSALVRRFATSFFIVLSSLRNTILPPNVDRFPYLKFSAKSIFMRVIQELFANELLFLSIHTFPLLRLFFRWTMCRGKAET